MEPTLRHRHAALVLATMSLLALTASIAESTQVPLSEHPNPPSEGFLAAESDAEAVAIADRVMLRMGGHGAWNSTRFITWRFFGNRFHIWDKHTGDIRVEGADRKSQMPYLILMNVQTKEGRAWRGGEEVTSTEELAELLDLGESAWINDSYWMFMPYKLKDSGVALKYLGKRDLRDGGKADVLELTFREVGRTPENKYEVYVAEDSGLVEQWDFFTNASDAEPRFQVPWRNWRRHGRILLSDDRGRGQHTGIAVYDSVAREVFTDPDPVNFDSLVAATSGDLAEAPIYTVEGDVMKPSITESIAPEYTLEAREARTVGQVVVRTVVGREGSVRDAWVTDPLDEGLDRSALKAIRQWKFDPATLDGAPVEVYYNLTVNFELERNPNEKGGSD